MHVYEERRTGMKRRYLYSLLAVSLIVVVAFGLEFASNYAAISTDVPNVINNDVPKSSVAKSNGSASPTVRKSIIRAVPPTAQAATQAPLPSANTPWAALYAALSERAASGDKDAATRLFRDTLRCIHFGGVQKRVDRALRATGETVADESADAAKLASIQERDLAAMQEILTANEAMCAAVTSEDLDGRVYPIMLHAAMAGDMSAATCFVGAGYFDGSSTDPLRQEEIVRFKNDARSVIHAGVESGNWELVQLLILAYDRLYGHRNDPNSLTDYLVGPNLIEYYAYNKLLSLGAIGPAATRSNLRMARILAEHDLSSEDRAIADAWARRTFHEQFAHSPPPDSDSFSYCGIDSG